MKPSSKSQSAKSARQRLKSLQFDAEQNLRLYSEATSLELSLLIATIIGELDYSTSEPGASRKERDAATWTAVSAAERALLFARNLKYFSQLSPNPPDIFDLSQLILDSVELAEAELNHRKIRPKVLVEANLSVETDPGCVEQIVLNLLELVKNNVPENGEFELTLKKQKGIDLSFGFNFAKTFEDPSLSLLLIHSIAENMGAEVHVFRKEKTFKLDFQFPLQASQPSNRNFTESRRYRRIRLKLPITLKFEKYPEEIKSEVNLLSVGGCFALLDSSLLVEQNDLLSIRVDYFQGCSVEIVKARVASLCWAGEKSGIGIEFIDVTPHAQKIVRALVKSHT